MQSIEDRAAQGTLIVHANGDDQIVEDIPRDKEYFYTFLLCTKGGMIFKEEKVHEMLRFKVRTFDNLSRIADSAWEKAIQANLKDALISSPPGKTLHEQKLDRLLEEIDAELQKETSLVKQERKAVAELRSADWFKEMAEKEQAELIVRVKNKFRARRIDT